MQKSMYSLILIDEIVAAIDSLAYEKGTSRSNLINQILADHVSMLTPEKRVEDIFRHAREIIESVPTLQVQGTQSATILSVKSALRYKYNPVIRYSVEIGVERGEHVAEFRVASRTQSGALVLRLNMFFEIWDQVEHNFLADKVKVEKRRTQISDGKYRRYLVIHKNSEMYRSDVLGKTIGVYIRLFDRAMGLYFAAKNGVDMETYQSFVSMYDEYLNSADVLI